MRRVSIRIKIMLWYTLLTAVLLAVSLPILYGAMAGSLRRDQEAYLRSAAGQLTSHIEWEDGELRLLNDLDLPAGTQYLLTTGSGGRVVSSESAWADAPPFQPDEVYLASNGKGDQLYLDQELELESGEKIQIRVSRSNNTVERSLEQLQLVMLLAVPAFLALAVFGSYFLAKLALRPIDHITEAAVSLGAGNLSRRIAGIESRDEVGRLAGAFNGMLARLEESFQREKQFTSDASHELRTPVSVIMAYAENLTAHAPDRETEEQASTILLESRRMHSIIAQLLALTRGYEGKYRLEREEVPLRDMVADVLAELTEEAAANEISLTEQVPEEIRLSADQSLMTQLLLNLVENGIKYGKPGGTVAVRAAEQDGHILLTVRDDGIGIEEKDLPRIFDRFYRADRARDRSGSGLGLSIVKWIVELHGWSIQAASKPGQGTVFTIQT